MDIHKLPTLDQLKVQLRISDPGQGKILPRFSAIGIHVDDHEALHAMTNEYGKVQFNTDVEFPDMLDVTSNFDVAMFFACCEWDSQQNSYQPVAYKPQPGVIYGVSPVLFDRDTAMAKYGAEFQFVGWQPLPRPAQQRAGAFIMQPGRCFATMPGVKRAYFRHDLKVAEKIWEAFQGGEVLFPYDEVAELCRTLQGLAETTRPVLDRAWSVLEKWEGKQIVKEHRRNVLKASGLRVVLALDLSWKKFNLPSNPQKLLERLSAELSDVRYRRAMYVK